MEIDEFMIPVSEYAKEKGLMEQEVIEKIKNDRDRYKGRQDMQGNWLVDRRSPLMAASTGKSGSSEPPLTSQFLYILAWLGLLAGGIVFYQMFDLRGGRFVGGIMLAAGVISFALFSALASGLTYLRQIEANTRNREETDKEV